MVTAPAAGDEEVQAMTEHHRESEWNVADWHGKMLVPVLRVLAESVHAGQDIRCIRQPAAPTPATGFPG
jgi:hypothetical protein